ncbi:MAG: glucuronate isomerase, partial [Treponema sp.]|nr:glucuronate isomerase [Treponema sp.]
YIAALGTAAGVSISSVADVCAALHARIAHFHKHGCRIADHGLDYLPFEAASDGALWEKDADAAFKKALAGEQVDTRSMDSYKTFVLNVLGEAYHDKGWVMQLHIAALRAPNTRMLKALGPDTGYDAVLDAPVSANLARLLNVLEARGTLPKTILYSLNAKDFYPLATIMGSFQGDGVPGKMQLGSAWWFLDHRDGMEAQMKLLGNEGLLSRFVGMLTDSRSFLSYPRHEYFRRILCNLIGTWAEQGEVPNDFALLSGMVRDISFRNAKRYFTE